MAYTVLGYGEHVNPTARALRIDGAAAYIMSWTRIARREKHDGGRFVTGLCTFHVFDEDHEIAVVRVYQHATLVLVGCGIEDEHEQECYEYIHDLLSEPADDDDADNPDDPADADDDEAEDGEGYDVESVRRRFADEDQHEKYLRSAEFRELCESLRAGPRCDDEEL